MAILKKKNAISIAKQLIKRGYNVIPTNASKQPLGVNWNRFQKEPMKLSDVDNYFKDHYNIGVLTGGTSRVVCLDADMKYDLTGTLWERFYDSIPERLRDVIYLQKTVGGGYHLVFIAPESCLMPNEKLASRYTTPEEKNQTYIDAYKDTDTREHALKTAINDKQRVLFETRSGSPEVCGGYFLIAPSDGYEYVKGKICEVSEEDYDLIMSIARSFNEVKNTHKYKDDYSSQGFAISPFDDYNDKSDVLSLLVESGWAIVEEGKKDVKLLRPGNSSNKYSAVFDKDTKIFNVYSTSTSFELKGYTPTGVFIELECDGDSSVAFKKLIEMGYGVEN